MNMENRANPNKYGPPILGSMHEVYIFVDSKKN